MYFGLPDSIPPRPLGEARVRKHCVVLLYGRVTNHEIYIIIHIVCYFCSCYLNIQTPTTGRQQNEQFDPSDVLVRVG